MERGARGRARRPRAGRARLRRGDAGDQLLAAALRSGDLAGDRPPVGGVSRSGCRRLRPRGRRGGPSRRRPPRRLRRGRRGTPGHHGPRRRGGGRGVHRRRAAPLPRGPDRPRHPALRGSARCRTTSATGASCSRSTSPATCRPRPWPALPSIRCGAYFDDGVTVTLCTDGWLMCGVSLTDEYWLAHTQLGFTREEIDQMIAPRLRERVPAAGPNVTRSCKE